MEQTINTAKDKMGKCILALESELGTIRAGRANPGVLDRISVDYYGTATPINQLASVSVAEARILVVSPYDGSMLTKIEKAIQASDLGINPTNDGRVLRIVFPQLTEERRKELVKQVKKMGEDAKVAARNNRRDAMEGLKKMKTAKEISEDESRNCEQDVEKSVGKCVEEIEKTVSAKEKELLTV